MAGSVSLTTFKIGEWFNCCKLTFHSLACIGTYTCANLPINQKNFLSLKQKLRTTTNTKKTIFHKNGRSKKSFNIFNRDSTRGFSDRFVSKHTHAHMHRIISAFFSLCASFAISSTQCRFPCMCNVYEYDWDVIEI